MSRFFISISCSFSVSFSVPVSLSFSIVLLSDLVIKPYDFLIINWLVTVFFIGGVRFLARWVLTKKSSTQKNVVIYGAGNSGAQLESAMKYDQETHIIGFLDDDPNKKGLQIIIEKP